ncbi:conserved hypothetical protein [Ricinus communis]|uniref:Uncharacterized protein n=1 Tax=Ricinus communis TaxID=3988 RepID=B9SRQ7_RICCO|nr:conserved hypothetical protein [Ricinus communis]
METSREEDRRKREDSGYNFVSGRCSFWEKLVKSILKCLGYDSPPTVRDQSLHSSPHQAQQGTNITIINAGGRHVMGGSNISQKTTKTTYQQRRRLSLPTASLFVSHQQFLCAFSSPPACFCMLYAFFSKYLQGQTVVGG